MNKKDKLKYMEIALKSESLNLPDGHPFTPENERGYNQIRNGLVSHYEEFYGAITESKPKFNAFVGRMFRMLRIRLFFSQAWKAIKKPLSILA